MKKTVKAVAPYIYKGGLNFKNKPFEAWRELGLPTVKGWYPRALHKLMFNVDVPTLWHGEARLVFVQPQTLYFDAGLSAVTHEMIPFVWDCWPQFFKKMAVWMENHNVKVAIFTCKETARLMQERFPEKKILYCPEGVDSKNYSFGGTLSERRVDLLEFGRPLFRYVEMDDQTYNDTCAGINHIRTGALEQRPTDEELYRMMGDAKMTICYPHCVTEPQWCDGLETLTQRYWECMLSGLIIIGHAPQELVDLIGYNPCIEVEFDGDKLATKIKEVLSDVTKYQALIDKNRETAEKMSDWTVRIKEVQTWLSECGYNIEKKCIQ